MTISVSDAGKRYNRDWIFRHFTYSFHTGTSYAITGPNGSGKSTLLQAIGGAVALSEGKMECTPGLRQAQADRPPLAGQAASNEQRTTNIPAFPRSMPVRRRGPVAR